MKRAFCFAFLFVLCSAIFSQAVHEWARRAGGTEWDYGQAIVADNSGNTYITGDFWGSADFGDSTLTSSGRDIFAAKMDINGNWLWVVSAGGFSDNKGYGIALDNSGNVYITGIYYGTVVFGDSTLVSSGDHDIYVAKLDNDGNWLWAVSAGSADDDYAYGLTVDSSGNSYVTGKFLGTAFFGTNSIICSSAASDTYVAKIDTNGNWLWAVRAGGLNSDNSWGISADGSGNCYVTGSFYGNATFGTATIYSSGGTDIFIAKINSVGNWLWAERAGSSNNEYGQAISVDNGGNCYVTGCFYSMADFGPTWLFSSGSGDIFIAKLDTNGNWLWAKNAGGLEQDYGYGISTDVGGNCSITGEFRGTATFGTTNLVSAGDSDIFIARLDTDGNWLWAERAGGTGTDSGAGIATDIIGNTYATGTFSGVAGFGSNSLTSSGGCDIFIAKLYVMPSSGFYWAVNGGGTESDYGKSVSTDSYGNSYVTGYFLGTSVFGSTTLVSVGPLDMFVAKLDPNGNWLWAVQAEGTVHVMGNDIYTNADGTSYVTGYFNGIAVFGSTTLVSSGNDIFVAKLDTDGNWLWAVDTGGGADDGGYGIAVDSDGNSYIAGHFDGMVNFGSTSFTTTGDFDICIAKLDSTGNWLWAKRAGGADYSDFGRGIDVNSNGDCFVTGSFASSADFGSTNLTASGNDVFVAKLDTDGNWLWASDTGGANSDEAFGIAIDGDGSCYVTGLFNGTVEFGTTSLTCSGANDIFVAKIDNGTWEWAKRAGGTATDTGFDITADNSGNSFLIGSFTGVADFGSDTLTSNGACDIFIAGLDSDGNWLSARRAGGVSYDEPGGIATDSSGNIFITGWFQETADFGEHILTSSGLYDTYIAKLTPIVMPGIPLPPLNLIIFEDYNEIILYWDAVTMDTNGQPITPDYYEIYWSDDPYGTFISLGTTTSLFYTDTEATLTTPGFYYVKAVIED